MLRRLFGFLTLVAIAAHVLFGCCWAQGPHFCCEMKVCQTAWANGDTASAAADAFVHAAVPYQASQPVPQQIEGHHHHHLPCPKERCQFLDSSDRAVTGLVPKVVIHCGAQSIQGFGELLAGHQTHLAAYDGFLHRTHSSTRSLSLTQHWLL